MYGGTLDVVEVDPHEIIFLKIRLVTYICSSKLEEGGIYSKCMVFAWSVLVYKIGNTGIE